MGVISSILLHPSSTTFQSSRHKLSPSSSHQDGGVPDSRHEILKSRRIQLLNSPPSSWQMKLLVDFKREAFLPPGRKKRGAAR